MLTRYFLYAILRLLNGQEEYQNMAYIFIDCRKELNMSKIDYRLEIQEENKQIELIKEITFLLNDLSIDKLKKIKDSITCID